MNSMRKKLLRWLLLGQLLAVTVSCLLTFFYVRTELEDLFDDRLRQLAYSVPSEDSSQSLSPPPLTNLQDDDDDFVIQLWQQDGTLLQHLNRKEGTPALADEGFSTYLSRGMLWRSFVLRRGEWLIQTSQPYTDRLEMTTGIALGAIAPVLVLVLLLGVVVWISVERSLRPLTRLTASLDHRRPFALEPLPDHDLPDELQPLVRALNQLLARLGAALDGQRRFIADAAHELRTPLAAVQLQTQVLQRIGNEEERTAALSQIRAGIERAGHLVGQLLTLARLDPDDRQQPFATLDLAGLLKTVVAEQAPGALARGIDLGVCDAQPVTLDGDAESLRILLENLLDNAVRYTPSGGRIDVTLTLAEGLARLEVLDTGPGIPAQERTRVLERFYRRPGSGTTGSGLGLSIVDEILDRHRGEIVLLDGENGCGLKVVVRLPVDPGRVDTRS